jgi:hypothetical protein
MKAFLVYDDFNSAANVNAALQRWSAQAGHNVHWDVRPWPVNMLKFPPVAEEAMADALDAHMLVFAGPCVHLVPFWFEDWLEEWVRQRQVRDVVVVIISDVSQGGSAAASNCPVSEFARRRGLEIVYSSETRINLSPTNPLTSNLRNRETEVRVLKAGDLNGHAFETHRGWGLNE